MGPTATPDEREYIETAKFDAAVQDLSERLVKEFPNDHELVVEVIKEAIDTGDDARIGFLGSALQAANRAKPGCVLYLQSFRDANADLIEPCADRLAERRILARGKPQEDGE